ncbi:MAG: WD40/YVTN/BNR-like repeat-containing protein, partial [Actinomycetota bacterium]
MPSLLVGTKGGLFELPLPRGGAVAASSDGGPVTALAARGSEVWTAFGGTTLHQRAPDGSWSAVAGVDERHAIASLLPDAPGLWVGTAGARLLRLQGDGLATVESFDRIDERVDWYTPWGGPPDTRSLASGGGAVYVNVHVGGILRSADGGGTWRQTIDIHADVHQVVAGPGGLVLA